VSKSAGQRRAGSRCDDGDDCLSPAVCDTTAHVCCYQGSGNTCSSDAECCSPNVCSSGTCGPGPCKGSGGACGATADCCSGLTCSGGACTGCVPNGAACTPGGPGCCPPYTCIGGVCQTP
jgi:hypothetical protein